MSKSKVEAITPAAAREIRESINVDEQIRELNCFITSNEPGISGWFWSTKGLSRGAVLALVGHFERAGWKATFSSDRDGPYIQVWEP